MTQVYQTPAGAIVEYDELIPMVRLDRTLWLTAEKDRVVEDGDLEAAHLYGNPGHAVPRAEAEKLGALPKEEAKPKAAPKPANKMAPKPEDK
jgi:hypothetical protein